MLYHYFMVLCSQYMGQAQRGTSQQKIEIHLETLQTFSVPSDRREYFVERDTALTATKLPWSRAGICISESAHGLWCRLSLRLGL